MLMPEPSVGQRQAYRHNYCIGFRTPKFTSKMLLPPPQHTIKTTHPHDSCKDASQRPAYIHQVPKFGSRVIRGSAGFHLIRDMATSANLGLGSKYLHCCHCRRPVHRCEGCQRERELPCAPSSKELGAEGHIQDSHTGTSKGNRAVEAASMSITCCAAL